MWWLLLLLCNVLETGLSCSHRTRTNHIIQWIRSHNPAIFKFLPKKWIPFVLYALWLFAQSSESYLCVVVVFFFRMCLLPSGTWTSSYIANLPIAIGILAFLNFLIYFVTILLFQLNSVSTIVNMQNNDMFDCVYNMRSAAGDMLSEWVVFIRESVGNNICILDQIHCWFLFRLAVVSIIRMIWRNVLIVKYPKLEFVKRQNLRSLSDTPRNQGIVNVILHLEGEYNVNVIKETLLSGVLQRRNKSGDYCFPKLRSILVTCWGYYAWKTQA